MAVSKRLRFEIFRRDNHTCRYCGRTAPDIKITIDHVVPGTLGGRDEPNNLVTACVDCNAGKSSVPADAALVDDVKQDALRWARAREVAAEMLWEARIALRREAHGIQDFWTDAFQATQGDVPEMADDAEQAIERWLALGLPALEMYQLIESAVVPRIGRVHWDNLWSYFAGCCWARLREIEAAAQALIDRGDI